MSMADPAISVCFRLSVDGMELGSFTTCDGLGCEVAVEAREEGGNNGFVYQLPGRMKFTNIKFSRPVNAESANVAAWMASMVDNIQRRTATIDAMTPDGSVLCSWNLDRVIPVKWTGPSFGVDKASVAIETLELAHHGFVYTGGG